MRRFDPIMPQWKGNTQLSEGDAETGSHMGIYQRLILPILLDWAMRDDRLAGYRDRTVGAARGLVLEIGVGSGLNLPRYDRAVERVCAIDPSRELRRRARDRAKSALAPVSLLRGSGEKLPFADAAFDTVVMTWTLCSIPDPVAAPIEFRRVIIPSALAPDTGRRPDRRSAASHPRRCFAPPACGQTDRDAAAAGSRLRRHAPR